MANIQLGDIAPNFDADTTEGCFRTLLTLPPFVPPS